jgi:hypothetical protein
MSPWASFLAIIAMQFAVFLALAYKKSAHVSLTKRIVVMGIVAGALFGIAFDLIVGQYLGIFNYHLGFELPFLLVNGALSYGLWMLTVLLLQRDRLIAFCGRVIFIGFVYEVSNYFFPVWAWTFGGSFLYQEGVVIIAGYCGLAALMALVATFATKTRFRAFSIIKNEL